MTSLHIEWKHFEKEGVTCARCGETGRTLQQVVAKLREELAAHGVRVTFAEMILAEDELAHSNAILFNGTPLEALIPGAKTSENHCRSCSELTGRETLCRTIAVGDALYEALPETLIRQAAFRAFDLQASVPALNEPAGSCCTRCD